MNERAGLAAFSRRWPENRDDFRTEADDSWKAYATTLRDLAANGTHAGVSPGLRDPNRQVRALSARALGFINDPQSVPALANTLRVDSWATARLLAVDSLGMIHTPAALAALDQVSEDSNKDVRLHAAIARERQSGLEPDAVEGLLAIDENDLGIARVDHRAPGFVLPTTRGSTSLAHYSGRYAVALYFLYGDG